MTAFTMLEGLDEDDTRLVLSAARRKKFKRGEAICREGDPGDSLFLLDKGHVAIRVTTPMGDVATMRVLGAGSQFGEIAVIEATPRSATVVALDPVEVYSLHRDVINELRAEHPTVDQVLLSAALNEVRRLTGALAEALYTQVPKRLARTLHRLLDVWPDGIIPLTQDDIAGLCGTTRQTTNEVLQQLAAEGAVLVMRGKIEIVDVARIARAAR